MDNNPQPALFDVSQFLGPGQPPACNNAAFGDALAPCYSQAAPLGPPPNSLPLGGQIAPPVPQGIAQTSDTLPMRYTSVQLKDYIMRQLGYPTWNVELTPQQIFDCINDALQRFSQWVPQLRFRPIAMAHSVHEYLVGDDCGMGVVNCQFHQKIQPIAALYGNLIDVSPLPLAGTGNTGSGAGVGDFDEYQRWAVTYKRVFSIRPDWLWDDARSVLLIHNPVSAYTCAATLYYPYSDTSALPHNGLLWVKEYALAKASHLLGGIYAKFSGAIPGPAQALTLDQGRRADAATLIKDLEDRLFGMQHFAELSID